MADVLVLGAGAVGSVLGAFLARAGDRVTLLGRAPHMAAIAQTGLRITGLFGEFRVDGLHALSDPQAIAAPADCVWVTVKSYDTLRVRSLAARWRKEDGVVVSAQNGIGNLELLAARVPSEALLGARVIFGARLVEPGWAEVTVSAEPVRIGAYCPHRPASVEQARHLAAHLSAAGISSEWCEDIHAELWGKLLYNAALNPLGALLGCHYGRLAEDEDTRALMDRIIREAFAVARAKGIALPWSSAEAYRAHFYGRLVPATYRHRSSMLQDLERGRPTEIEAINGAVWRLGQELGVDVTCNELLTRLLRARSNARPVQEKE